VYQNLSRLLASMVILLGLFSLAEPGAETPLYPTVSSRVLSILHELEARPKAGTGMPQWSGSLKGARVDKAGRLEVMIRMTEITADMLKELEDHGSAIEMYDQAQNLVQAWIPFDKITEVADLNFVKFLDLPDYGVTNGVRE